MRVGGKEGGKHAGVIVDVLGAMVSNGTLGKHRDLIDKPVELPKGEYDPAIHGRRWSTPAKGG